MDTRRYCRQHDAPYSLVQAVEEHVAAENPRAAILVELLVLWRLGPGFDRVEGVDGEVDYYCGEGPCLDLLLIMTLE